MTTPSFSTPTLRDLRKQRDAIMAIMAHYHVQNVRVFGSVARHSATSESDVDLLVDLPEPFSLLQLSSLVQDLQDLLGFRVQITSANHLRPELRDNILRDAQTL